MRGAGKRTINMQNANVSYFSGAGTPNTELLSGFSHAGQCDRRVTARWRLIDMQMVRIRVRIYVCNISPSEKRKCQQQRQQRDKTNINA